MGYAAKVAGAEQGPSSISELSDVNIQNLSENDLLVKKTNGWENVSGYVRTIELTQAQYNALSSSEKNRDDVQYYITDAQEFIGEICDGAVSEHSVYSSAKIDPLLPRVTPVVSCLIGDTTVTFTHPELHTTSQLRNPFFQNASNKVTNLQLSTIAEGSATYTFTALTEATDFYLVFYNMELVYPASE